MNDELERLNKKIKCILEEKDLPESIKEKIKKVYEEYRMFYEEYLKNDIEIAGQWIASNNLQEYFNKNYLEALTKIQDKYIEKCREKAEVITIVLSTLESQKNKSEDKQIEQSERDILNKCVNNDRENNRYTNSVINIVIDSIENLKNQLFRTLDLLRTNKQKMEYINDKIKVIEDSAKLKLGSIKTDLDIDDNEISKQIFFEYEQYEKNEEKTNQKESENAHQEFVKEYRFSKEDLQVVPEINEYNRTAQEKEHGDLSGNVIR